MCRLYLVRTYQIAENGREAERKQARDFFDDDYYRYVGKHGHHFTDKLAEHASKMMTNADDSRHVWTCMDVHDTMQSIGIEIPVTSTLGDMTYSANMAYADLYPIVLKDTPSCVLYARAIAEDKDGYEGIQFYRWLADLMATDTKIEWDDFV